MKRIFTIFVIAFTIKSANTFSQTVYNGNFEQVNSDGTISNWGNIYLFTLGDSVVWDNRFYSSSSDAYSGSKAMELRNAWNYTTGTGIAGSAAVDDDSVFTAWSMLNLVSTNSTPFIPFNFSFYFKYFPVNGDSAYARIALWDSSGNQLGEGLAVITGTYGNYTQAVVPIVYTMPGDVAFYSMNFSTFFSLAPGSHQPGFGTRLLVDNITFNNASIAGVNEIHNKERMEVYPNPAGNQINIKSDIEEEMQFYIYNVFGEIVMQGSLEPSNSSISLEKFSNGLYTIGLNAQNKIERYRFVVSR